MRQLVTDLLMYHDSSCGERLKPDVMQCVTGDDGVGCVLMQFIRSAKKRSARRMRENGGARKLSSCRKWQKAPQLWGYSVASG